jgi:hypothetical protein
MIFVFNFVRQVTSIWTTVVSWLSMEFVDKCLASDLMPRYIRRWTSRVTAADAKKIFNDMLSERVFIWHGEHDIGSQLPLKVKSDHIL